MTAQPPKDPATVFHQNDYLRRSIIASYCLVVFLALPLWWNTTSIKRLALPVHRVSLHAENDLRLPVYIHVGKHEKELQNLLDNSVPPNVDVKVTDNREQALKGPTDSTYTILDASNTSVSGRTLSCPTSSLTHVSDLLSSLLVPFTASRDAEQRVAQYSPRYRLAFSLLNEDAAAGGAIIGWEITKAIRRYFSPIFEQLSVLHNFTIESQIQFHAPLAFKPTQLEGGTFALTQEELTIFVNSAEWSLSSSASNDPVLHFVVFIPSLNQSPLRILAPTPSTTPNNLSQSLSPSNAFLLPQWGTILLYNPPHRDGSTTKFSLSDLDPIFQLFSDQLLALLGAPDLPITVSSIHHPKPPSTIGDSAAVLTEWQLDALMRRRSLENAQKAKDTLHSIVKLVDEIQNMPVGKDVRDDVVNALNELDEMYASSQHSLAQTFQHSARALTLASRAFFNPSMLALLYFPAEHNYAVYTPLFASALIPMVVTTIREFKAWRVARRAVVERT